MTEQELRQSVLDAAGKWVGCKEADGSHRKIIDTYNEIRPLPRGYRMTYDDPWCATFVSACGYAAGLSDIIFPECGCIPMINLYKQHGRWMEDDSYKPQRGDVIFYDWEDSGYGDNTGASDHVGLVWSTYGDDMTIIEGNKGNCVSFRDLKRNGKYIRGFGLPDYASKADTVEAPEVVIIPDEPEEEEPTVCAVELPILSIGMESEAVRAAQTLLEKRGFRCGWMGCDGEFGPKTEGALGKFKIAYNLDRNPTIDAEAWTALILGVGK